MIEILMADDHAIFRSGVRRLLSDEPDIRVVAEAANGVEAIEQLRRRAFDVVLLDVNMGGRSGFDTLRRIHAEWPTQAVIMLSMYPEEQYLQLAFKAGVRAYLSKDRDAHHLIAAIRSTASGGFYVPTGHDPLGVARQRGDPLPHFQLTDRERQVMASIVRGQSLTAIGKDLCLSVKTVSTYRYRVLTKLNLASNAELVRYCLENDIAD
jgi:DNA-binding NarL/FixJ family response regulator